MIKSDAEIKAKIEEIEQEIKKLRSGALYAYGRERLTTIEGQRDALKWVLFE